MILRTFSTGSFMVEAISSLVGSSRGPARGRGRADELCSWSRSCGPGSGSCARWSAMARVIAWRNPPGGVGAELVTALPLELVHGFMRPMLPSWMRSRNWSPRLVYFLAMDTTSRRLASPARSWRALPALRPARRPGAPSAGCPRARRSPAPPSLTRLAGVPVGLLHVEQRLRA